MIIRGNIFPFESVIKSKDRHVLNGHRSGVLWFTGLSGSGKSTLAHAVEAYLHELNVRSYVLDGDNIRSGLNKDLGLNPEGRKENIRGIADPYEEPGNPDLIIDTDKLTLDKSVDSVIRFPGEHRLIEV